MARRFHSSSELIRLSSCLGVAIIGTATIIGWIGGYLPLIQVLPGASPMKANTAFALLVSAFGLARFGRSSAAARVAGALVFLLGAATIVQYAAAVDFGLDELLLRDWSGGEQPGRMGLNTALCLAVTGLTLSVATPASAAGRAAVLACSVGLLSVSVAALIGYAIAVEPIYRWGGGSTRMAIHTAASFALLGTGFLSTVWGPALPGRRWYLPLVAGGSVAGVTVLASLGLLTDERQRREAEALRAARNELSLVHLELEALRGAVLRLDERRGGDPCDARCDRDLAAYLRDISYLRALGWIERAPSVTLSIKRSPQEDDPQRATGDGYAAIATLTAGSTPILQPRLFVMDPNHLLFALPSVRPAGSAVAVVSVSDLLTRSIGEARRDLVIDVGGSQVFAGAATAGGHDLGMVTLPAALYETTWRVRARTADARAGTIAGLVLMAGILVSAFVTATIALWQSGKQQVARIGELNAELESRVDARTRELTLVARDLEASVQHERAAQEQLRNQGVQLRQIFDLGRVRSWSVDVKSGDSDLGPLAELYGLPPDHDPADADAVWRAVHAEDRDRMHRLNEDLRTGRRRHWRDEFRVVWPDGTVHWLSSLAELATDADDVPSRVVGTAVDISARREAEAALHESETRFKALAESLPQLVWSCQPDGACDYLSPQWMAYTGAPESEQLGYGWLAQLHPDDVAPTQQRWTAAATTGAPFDTEFRIRRHDGAFRWFKTRGVPVFDASGHIIKWYGSNTDIQELKDAQSNVEQLNRDLEARVATRTNELVAANRHLATLATQLKTAQRLTNVGSWELDVATGKVVWSDELFQIFGLEQTAGAPDYASQQALFEPESWDRLTKAIDNSIERAEGYEITLNVLRQDGGRRIAVARAEALKDGSGVVKQLVGTFQDVSERQRVAGELQKLSERLQLATSAAGIGVWEWHIPTNEIIWDETMHRLYGTSPDQFGGVYDAWSAAVHPEDRASTEHKLWDAVKGVGAYQTTFRIVRGGGEVRYLAADAAVVRDPLGQPVRMIGVNWDVTAPTVAGIALQTSEAHLRDANARLGETQRRLQSVLDAATQIAIIATDADGIIQVFNSGAERMLQYRADEMVGLRTLATLHDQEECAERGRQLTQELGRAVEGFEVFVARAREFPFDEREWTCIRKDGSRLDVLLIVTAVRDEAGTIIGYLGMATDITTRKRLEATVREKHAHLTAALKEKEVLLQEVHHRVKNNLQIISSLLNMQLRQLPDATSRAGLEESRARVSAIALIHEQLYQSKNYERVQFSEYVKSLAAGIFHATGRSPDAVSLRIDVETVSLPVDKAIPCGLILNELITNVFKHAFPDGRHGTVEVTLRRENERNVVLSVTDDGIGIPRHFRAETSASLGVQLMAALVEQLDGHWVIQRHDGTKVTVSFPVDHA